MPLDSHKPYCIVLWLCSKPFYMFISNKSQVVLAV